MVTGRDETTMTTSWKLRKLGDGYMEVHYTLLLFVCLKLPIIKKKIKWFLELNCNFPRKY